MKLYAANKVRSGWTLFRIPAGIAAAGLPLAIGMLTAPRTEAQSPARRPEFEVASIKPNIDGGPRVFIGERSPGTFSAENVTLQNLIQEAYGSPSEHWLPYRKAPQPGLPIFGGPGWARSDRCDVTAKAKVETGDKHPVWSALFKGVRLRKLFVDGQPVMEIDDFGDSEAVLRNRSLLKQKAWILIKRGIIPDEDGWGGWLGRYQSTLRKTALDEVDAEKSVSRYPGRDRSRGR